MKQIIFIFSVLIGIIGIVIPSGFTLAQSQVSPTLSITPPKYELNIIPGQLQQVETKITNLSDIAIPLKAVIMDFAPKDETGGINFGTAIPGHQATSWFSISPSSFLLSPQDSQDVKITLDPPDTLSNGSYLAVIMFQAQFPSNYFESEAQAKIIPWIGQLFIMTAGKPNINDQTFSVTKFQIPWLATRDTIPFDITIHNNSGFALDPQVEFQLKKIQGPVVAEDLTEKTTILPGSARQFRGVVHKKSPLGIFMGQAQIRIAGYRTQVNGNIVYLISLMGAGAILELLFIYWLLHKYRFIPLILNRRKKILQKIQKHIGLQK